MPRPNAPVNTLWLDAVREKVERIPRPCPPPTGLRVARRQVSVFLSRLHCARRKAAATRDAQRELHAAESEARAPVWRARPTWDELDAGAATAMYAPNFRGGDDDGIDSDDNDDEHRLERA